MSGNHEPLRPLEWKDGLAPSRSIAERALWVIPIVGWFIAELLETRRIRPAIESIERQLHSRHLPTIEMWGDDESVVEIARMLCSTLEENMGWPNDRFIPDDPVEIALWSHIDGLDHLEAVISLERRLDVSISDDEVLRWFDNKYTLGDVVASLISSQHTS